MEEPHEGYKMVKGVRVDIKSLLTNFENSGSVRFSSFVEEWQKKKFSLIFCRRRLLRELVEFCEEVFHIAKGYLEPPWSFPIRVGALFCLYGLYFRQPLMKTAKIRLTLPEWQNLDQFIQECKAAKHFDVCLVHYKMYIKGAYVFTAVARASEKNLLYNKADRINAECSNCGFENCQAHYITNILTYANFPYSQSGMERGFRKYGYRRKRKKKINERILKRGNILEPELLEEMKKMEGLYQEKKTEVLGSKNLDFVDHDFSGSLMKKLNDFYMKIEVEYPSAAIEEFVSAEKPRSSTGPVVVQNTVNKPTIQERTCKRQIEKRKRALEITEVVPKTEGAPQEDLSLPDIT